MPDWFRRRHHAATVSPDPVAASSDSDEQQRRSENEGAWQGPSPADVPAGVFVKCEKCGHLLITKEFERDLRVCSRCGHHHKLTADARIACLADEDSWAEMNADLVSLDPLHFPEYAAKAAKGQQTTGRGDGLVTGTARIGGYACVLGVMDFRYMGGSMGSVFGEKFVAPPSTRLPANCPSWSFAPVAAPGCRKGCSA
jgi:acetyl-CoA carboxylase beta subunit